ncbi:S-layer homology domain-containing protein [Candidatus Margulisiibacteriota bacterium]
MNRIFLLILLAGLSVGVQAVPQLKDLSVADKSVVYSDAIDLSGRCSGVYAVYVNGAVVDLVDNEFRTELLLDGYGKQTIFVTLYDTTGKKLERRIRLLYLKQYKDLSGHKLEKLITILSALGYLPDSYGESFSWDSKISLKDKTNKNAGIWQKANLSGLDRERFAVLLFNDPEVKREISAFLKWDIGFSESLAVKIKPALPEQKLAAPQTDTHVPQNTAVQTKEVIPVKKTEVQPAVPLKKVPEVTTQPKVIKPNLYVYLPLDKTITKKRTLFVKGKVLNNAKYALINNIKFVPDNKGLFGGEIFLNNIGKNNVNITTPGPQGEQITRRVIRLKSYKDISEKNVNSRIISYIGTLGYLTSDNYFYPNTRVLKEEMAYILVKILNLPLPRLSKDPFRDVDAGYKAAPYIKAIVDKNLLGVYPDGTFRPKEELTRYQALIILARLEGLDINSTEVRSDFPFKDVNKKSALARILQASLDADLISPSPLFNGSGYLTRSALALLLSKVSIIKENLNVLTDWEQGYDG